MQLIEIFFKNIPINLKLNLYKCFALLSAYIQPHLVLSILSYQIQSYHQNALQTKIRGHAIC